MANDVCDESLRNFHLDLDEKWELLKNQVLIREIAEKAKEARASEEAATVQALGEEVHNSSENEEVYEEK